MKHVSKILLMGIALLLLSVVVFSANAQDNVIVEGSFGAGADTLTPLYCTGTDCTRIEDRMFPDLVEVTPGTGLIEPNAPGGLATSWDISDDGLVWTFHLRDDMFWTDGTPVTSADVLYGWNQITAPEANSPNAFLLDLISNVEAPDPQTIVVTFPEFNCTALNNVAGIPVVPSHVLSDIPFSELENAEFNTAPTVTAGPYQFSDFRAGEVTVLVANPDYVDLQNGVINNDGYIWSVVPDQTVEVERFLAGEFNIIDSPAVERRADVRSQEGVTAFDFAGNSWDYVGWNLADPTNPQPAFDEDGNPIDQGHHPIFGDVRVRRALTLAVNIDEIIDGAVFGEGVAMAANIIPTSWAIHPTLEPIGFDPEAAAALLEEAGWVDTDGDGIREATADALYAEEGTEMRFELLTNEGNTRRASIATIMQDQLGQIGVAVDFRSIEFNSLLDVMDSQEFDAFILGWRNGFPDDPDQTQLFGAAADVPGSGFNFTSYNNPEFDQLMSDALSVPGCDQAERAQIYARIQEIFQEDLPYMPLFVQGGQYAANGVDGFDPFPNELYWNVENWSLTP